MKVALHSSSMASLFISLIKVQIFQEDTLVFLVILMMKSHIASYSNEVFS